MILKTGFNKFLDKINLDETRKQRLISAHNTLRGYLEADEEIKKYLKDTFLQGSYNLKTAIKPLNDGEYDVDVILSLDLKDKNGDFIMDGYEVVNWLYNRIINIDAYKGKIDLPKTRCVRIRYARDLRLDVTPVHFNGDEDSVLLIPPDWKETDPKSLRKWCQKINEDAFSLFYPITKILKFWRNIQFGEDSHPKSILLTTIIGENIRVKEEDTLHQALTKTMVAINNYLDKNDNVPEVCNPSLKTEKLSESWQYYDYLNFKNKFESATNKINETLNESDEQKTIDILNSAELFNGSFPVTLYEDIKKNALGISEALTSGSLGVTSTGKVGIGVINEVTKVKPTKFYGKD